MNTVLVAESVLHTEWRANQEARRFVNALAQSYRIVVGLEHNDVERFKIFAKMEDIKEIMDVVPAMLPAHLRGSSVRQAQIEDMQGRGYGIEFLIDNDPSNVAEAMENGVSAVLWCHAKIQRPEWRPDFTGKIRPWDELVSEINTQHYLSSQLPDEE